MTKFCSSAYLVALGCCFSLPTLSDNLKATTASLQNRLLVTIKVTARTKEAAIKDANRLKTAVVYAALQDFGLKPLISDTKAETKRNDNMFTYTVTMTGKVIGVKLSTDKDGNKQATRSSEDYGHASITSFSLSNNSGTNCKGPYHDVEVVVGSHDDR